MGNKWIVLQCFAKRNFTSSTRVAAFGSCLRSQRETKNNCKEQWQYDCQLSVTTLAIHILFTPSIPPALFWFHLNKLLTGFILAKLDCWLSGKGIALTSFSKCSALVCKFEITQSYVIAVKCLNYELLGLLCRASVGAVTTEILCKMFILIQSYILQKKKQTSE